MEGGEGLTLRAQLTRLSSSADWTAMSPYCLPCSRTVGQYNTIARGVGGRGVDGREA